MNMNSFGDFDPDWFLEIDADTIENLQKSITPGEATELLVLVDRLLAISEEILSRGEKNFTTYHIGGGLQILRSLAQEHLINIVRDNKPQVNTRN